MRHSRRTAFAALAALLMAVVALCPCGPLMAAMVADDGAAGGDHDCCVPRQGISANSDGCCADDAERPAAASASVAPALAPPVSHEAVLAAASRAVEDAAALAVPHAASPPPILRI